MRHYLLPNKYQMPALIVFLVALVATTATFIPTLFDPQSASTKGIQFALVLIENLALLVTVFSAEKMEDEFFTRMRLHSGAVALVIGIAAITVLNLIQIILPYGPYASLKEWRMEHLWNGNLIMYVMVLYFIIFKVNVHRLEKKMNDEK